MLQHAGVTPIVLDPHLREALVDLNFNAVSTRFGCFFIKELDLNRGHLPGVEEADPPAMLQRMGVEPGKEKKKPADVVIPSGDSLTWKTLGKLLNQVKPDDRVKLQELRWEPKWMAFSAAQDLFRRFTEEYWLSLTDVGVGFELRTLKEAMGVWTLQQLNRTLKRTHMILITPSADDLRGNIPNKSKNQLFSNKRTAFFPEPGVVLNKKSKMVPFFSAQGYITRYHEAISKSTDAGKGLRDVLDNIFDLLRILPLNPGKPGDVRPLWYWKHDQLNILLNSKYIMLTDRTLVYKSGKAREQRVRGKNKVRSNDKMVRILAIKRQGTPPRTMTKVIRKAKKANEKDIMQGRRGKQKKNSRKPPVRQKQATEQEDLSLEAGWAGPREDLPSGAQSNTREKDSSIGFNMARSQGGGGANQDMLPPITCIEDEISYKGGDQDADENMEDEDEIVDENMDEGLYVDPEDEGSEYVDDQDVETEDEDYIGW